MYVRVVVGKGARLECEEKIRKEKLIKGNVACMRSGIGGFFFPNRADSDSVHSSQKLLIHINTIC